MHYVDHCLYASPGAFLRKMIAPHTVTIVSDTSIPHATSDRKCAPAMIIDVMMTAIQTRCQILAIFPALLFPSASKKNVIGMIRKLFAV